MFHGCTSLVSVPALSATTMAERCCAMMFSGCTSLVNAPALPATTLALDCYGHMFENCTSLVNAPDLPATTLAESCYNNMFINCTSLVIAPDLPATTVGISCYTFMFQGCTGLLIPAELPAETLIHNCYQAMFKGCTSMKFSENKDESYNAGYRVPKSGNGTIADSSNALDEMFTGTNGAAFTPAINTTYYRVGYSVNITGGKNATASGGSTKQTALSREMTTVTFTPDSGYHFAEFDDITKDNVTVHRVSNVEVRVSGIPTAYVEIAVPDAAEGAPGKVPFTEPGQRYASSEDNFAPIASSGSIKSLVLDFSKVAGSEVKPSELRMTGIKGSVFTTKDKLRDKKSFKTTGGVKVRVNKDMTAKIICRKSGTATLTIADGNTYTITFKVQKPKAQKNAKIIPKGGSMVIKTVRDLFGTDIDAGELTIHKQKHSQATISDNKLYVDPKEEDKIKVRYKYLDKKYKITVKVK
ncbi:MAG: hypothetical protein IJS80_05920 [Lachnospiraceae bacterium]|nr:hypothetical protein [Lachnospiraceae bacterium]